MGRLTLTTLLLLGACTPEIPVQLTTPEEGSATLHPSDETRELLDDAFGFWGVSYRLVNDGRWYGTLRLTLVDLAAPEGEEIALGAASRRGCMAQVWADRDVNVLRHELGHVFIGPEHHPDPDNLMASRTTDNEDVTDKQYDQADFGAATFAACR